MYNLLAGYFFRFKRSPLFIIATFSMVVVGIASLCLGNRMVQVGMLTPDRYIIDYFACKSLGIVVIIVTIFCTYFHTIEYLGGTIRNKLIGGYNRHQIYMAVFLTNTVISCLLFTIYVLTVVIAGNYMMAGGFQIYKGKRLVLFMICAYMLVIAIESIFTVIAANISNSAWSVCVGGLGTLGLYCFGVAQANQLTNIYMKNTADGMLKWDCKIFLLNYLPSGQMIKFFVLSRAGFEDDIYTLQPVVMLSGSISILALSVIVGEILFHKKNIN